MTDTILLLLTVCLAAQLSPGPDMILIIRHATTSFRSAMICICGVCLGMSAHTLLSAAGLAVIIAKTPWLFSTIRYAGAAYLVYAGIHCLTEKGGLCLTPEPPVDRAVSTASPFRDGLFCNLLNPKVTLFVISLFSQVIAPTTPFPEKLIYAGVIVGEAFFVWILLALLLDRPAFRQMMENWQRTISKTCGLLLMGLAAMVAIA